jgi:serine/threonine-protein phosphatase 2A activator
MADIRLSQRHLAVLDAAHSHEFIEPVKRINDGPDVSFFLTSIAYRDLWSFIFQLNASMFPRKSSSDGGSIQVWELGNPAVSYSSTVANLKQLLEELGKIILDAPPHTGPRRFGNISFRRWHEIVESRLPDFMQQYIPSEALDYEVKPSGGVTAKDELKAYLSGSFGSAQRLDYGTGHELSFVAFLACIWKLGGFPKSQNGEEERAIVLGVIEPYVINGYAVMNKTKITLPRYLKLIRKLILTYTLEPAGSHGVWGLDDHFFIPYIFGSAQLSPPIETPADIATEGSLEGASKPTDITKSPIVDRERERNMYFSAIGFINDVKKGPFWEHSPILFDITGVKGGWAKINKVHPLCHAESSWLAN